MFSFMRKKNKFILAFAAILLLSVQTSFAAGPPAPSIFSNPLAVVLIILMIILLIIIGVLAGILIGAADVKSIKRKEEKNKPALYATISLFFLLCNTSIFGQDNNMEKTTAANTIGGMDASVFYLMASVIFLELALILVMLFNIRTLIKVEKNSLVVVKDPAAKSARKIMADWWDKMNKFRPVTREAEMELDLGHEYDGIRELNNKLPPWWLYGFYLTILFAGVYLWRFHISHDGPSSKQEYETAVAKAEIKIQEYLRAKGDAVDENSVTFLKEADDLAKGKIIFQKSCASCHTESGAGNIGPNLTDNYWIHGNDMKSIFKTIRYGINAMPQWQNSYSNKEIAQVASFVKSLKGTNPPNPKAPQGVEIKEEVNTIPLTDTAKSKNDKVAANLGKN